MRNILAEIITIGDEILIGQIVDTNSAWIGKELNDIGIKVYQITSVQDNEDHILQAFSNAEDRVDLIIVTGGLGPTKDDITKKTMCKYFDCDLITDTHVLEDITKLFAQMGREMNDVQKGQALVPRVAKAIRNENGTAPGIWIEKQNKIFISMPGVPYEMKGIMNNSVLPMLQDYFETPAIVHKTILTQGVGETIIAEKIKDFENELPTHIKLAYLPSVGSVRLRLSAFGKNKNELQNEIDALLISLMKEIEKYVFGFDEDTLEKVIGELLKKDNSTIAIAESCTGGYISHLITKVPGSSDYLKGSVVSYANEIKIRILGVEHKSISENGAVSQQVVEQMAANVLKKFDVDYSIATSGIAGPTGGSVEKPVGTVWIAVASKDKVVSQMYLMGNNRERTIERTSLTALMMLRKMILNI